MRRLIVIGTVLLGLAGCATPSPGSAQGGGTVIRDFSFPWSDRTAPRTECRIEVRGERLHFTFEVDDPDVVVEAVWRGEATVDGEDRVELFFAADETLSRYWCLEVDPLGRVHDYAASHYRKFDSDWNGPGLETAGRRTRPGYRVEGSLPLATLSELLGQPVGSGSVIRLGLFRAEFYGLDARTRGEASDNWLSWVRPTSTQPDFHVPSAFREFRLP